MDFIKSKNKFFKHLIIIPILSLLAFPILVLDILVEIYHKTCFPLYGTKYVKRKDFIKFDRHKLDYLNIIQKMYCFYCAYGNGVVLYWGEIAANTEKYWCGIMHKKELEYQKRLKFAKYNNKKDFEKKFKN